MVESSSTHDLQDIIWNKAVMLKISIFTWRLLRNQNPTKDNLVRRGIIQPNFNVCVRCCGIEESINHLFLGCDVFGCIWLLVRQWLFIHSLTFLHLSDHVLHFSMLAQCSKTISYYMNFV